MTKQYILEASSLTPRIWIGQPNSAGTAFRDGKEDATDLAIHRVAEYVQHHFGNALRAEYSDLAVEVRVTEPGHDLPVTERQLPLVRRLHEISRLMQDETADGVALADESDALLAALAGDLDVDGRREDTSTEQ